jgi:hypothetical protein
VASGAIELRENGGRVASLCGICWEVRGSGEKPLLHRWSEQLNLTRRSIGASFTRKFSPTPVVNTASWTFSASRVPAGSRSSN